MTRATKKLIAHSEQLVKIMTEIENINNIYDFPAFSRYARITDEDKKKLHELRQEYFALLEAIIDTNTTKKSSIEITPDKIIIY